MKTLMSLPIALLFLLPQDEIKGDTPWRGFGIGSWVKRTRLRKQGEKTTEVTARFTLAELKDGAPMVKEESPEGEGLTSHVPGWAPRKEWLKSKGTGILKIDSKEIPCTTLQYEWEDAEKKIKGSATYWLAAEARVPYREIPLNGPDLALPPGVVKLRFENVGPKQEVRVDLEVRSFARKHLVGAREIPCVAEEAAVREGPAEGTLKRLLSDKVPGAEVEVVVEGKVRDVPFEMRQTVVDFEVRP